MLDPRSGRLLSDRRSQHAWVGMSTELVVLTLCDRAQNHNVHGTSQSSDAKNGLQPEKNDGDCIMILY